MSCAVDTEIVVAHDAAGDIATATVAKQRDGIAGQRLVAVELGQNQAGGPVTSCVVAPTAGAAVADDRKAGRRLSLAGKIALDTLRKAIVETGDPAPASNHIPPAALVVSVETWRRYHHIGTANDGQTPEARKKAFQRARDQLQAVHAIGIHDDLAWVVADA